MPNENAPLVTPNEENAPFKSFTNENEFKSHNSTIQNELLNKAGVKSLQEIETMRSELADLKKNNQTEAERIASELEEWKTKATTYESENTKFQNEKKVLAAKVSPEYLEFVTFEVGKLEGEFETNLQTYLENNSKYLTQNDHPTKTTGVPNKGISTGPQSGVSAILKEKYKY